LCPYKCLKTCDFHTAPYCIAAALRNAQDGLLDQGFAFTGANAHRVKKLVTVEQLMSELLQGYSAAVDIVQEPCTAVMSH
jgi:nitronate monooxygenase